MKQLFIGLGCLLILSASAQTPTASPPQLTVEKIMQDPKGWIGTAPSSIFWSEDSKTIYFNWNPTQARADSLYKIVLTGDRKPLKVSPNERRTLPSVTGGTYNRARTLKLYEKDGDLFLLDCKPGKTGTAPRQLTNTVERETNPVFSGDEQKAVFARSGNLFTINLSTGELSQVTNLDPGTKKAPSKPNEQESWLKRDQLALFDVLRARKEKKGEGEKITKTGQPKRPKQFYTDGRTVQNPQLSPDSRFVTFSLVKSAQGAKTAIVPNYVTESGFTEDLTARTKVGAPFSSSEFFVYDIQRDTIQPVSTKTIPGITDLPDYAKAATAPVPVPDSNRRGPSAAEPAADSAQKTKKPTERKVTISGPIWSEDGKYAVVIIRAFDNKDRWIMRLDPATRQLKPLDRQRDEAWVSNFGGAANSSGFLADNQTFYFLSEADGYSHLYTVNVETGAKSQLTKGKFEVQQVQLSNDKKSFYLTTNEVHPGEQHFYRMAVTGGERVKLTTMTGANDVTLSPDETKMAVRYSYSNKPWELFLMNNDGTPARQVTMNKGRGKTTAMTAPIQLTSSLTPEFQTYPWRDPALVTIPARDGQTIYGRLYKPAKPNGKAVLFVHGAGYLQNAHKWWSQYFREYMFHNLLADKGYTVLDIDYRASAGYGRDWRTGIYRHMGGKDLTDNIDAAQWLIKTQGVDAKRIGLYGGSYGGFITLMAMFTTPDVFAAGAALRPVTDWAAYNHGYTANILNEPYTDTLAYQRSSPIYFANGLKGHLLICHGMVDVNVHYQDVVRLTQRLIELKKENWEVASYPVEDHAFVEPTSWMDEYKRILKLFEERL